jgi:hypothetical protein
VRDLARMSESVAPKPKFTRRRVILGAAGLALILAVALVRVGVFGGYSRGSVNTTFMGFEQSADKSSFLAVLYLTNEMSMDFVLVETDEGRAVAGRFHSQSDYVECWLGRRVGESAIETYNFKPHSARVVRVPLPNDGRTGRVEVSLGTTELIPNRPLGRLRHWWRSYVPLLEKKPQAICEQVIQCPLVLPDGTVEPPRLLSAPDPKR